MGIFADFVCQGVEEGPARIDIKEEESFQDTHQRARGMWVHWHQRVTKTKTDLRPADEGIGDRPHQKPEINPLDMSCSDRAAGVGGGDSWHHVLVQPFSESGPGPATSASPENILGLTITKPHLRPT